MSFKEFKNFSKNLDSKHLNCKITKKHYLGYLRVLKVKDLEFNENEEFVFLKERLEKVYNKEILKSIFT